MVIKTSIFLENLCKGCTVRLKDKKFPEVLYNGKWSPICGLGFWNTNWGATLFCKELGYSTGIINTKDYEDKPLESDGINIGECTSQDNWLDCSNKQIPSSDCAKGNLATVEVECLMM